MSKELLTNRYKIIVSDKENGPGYWNYKKVDIVDCHSKNLSVIGSYTRNYPSFATNTFYPFYQDNEWYALYSSEYTATRVCKLTDKFEDWCGEENSSSGFCPVEFYVPRIATIKFSDLEDDIYEVYEDNSKDFDNLLENEILDIKYSSFGFVAGCIWGDDSSWKLEVLDLRNVKDKQLSRVNSFGYLQLPNADIKECLNFIFLEDDRFRVSVTHVACWDVFENLTSSKF